MARRSPVPRILKAHLRDFRGYRDEHEIDLEADIVILTGSNGYGKTSLIDGLNLALNGHGDPRLPAEALIHARCEEAEVAIDADGLPPRAVRAEVRRGDLPQVSGMPSAGLPSKVCAAASVFYQDQLHRAVAESFLEEIVADFLLPPLGIVDDAQVGLEVLTEQLADAGRTILPAQVEGSDTIDADRLAAAAAVSAAWAEAHRLLPELFPDLATRRLYDPVGGRLYENWRDELRELTEEVGRQAGTVGEEGLGPDYTDESCLSLLGSALSTFRSKLPAGKKSGISASALLSAIEGLPDGQLLSAHLTEPLDEPPEGASEEAFDGPLPLPTLGPRFNEIDRAVRRYDKEIAALDKQLASLREWLRDLEPQDETGLGEVLAAIEERGKTWKARLRSTAPPGLPRLPVGVKGVVGLIDSQLRTLAEETHSSYAEWVEKVEEAIEERQERHRLLHLRRERLEAAAVLGGRLMELTAAQRKRLTGALLGQAPFEVGELRARLARRGGEAAGNDPHAVLSRLDEALGAWRKVESRRARRGRLLDSLPGYRRARSLLDEAAGAVAAERSADGVLHSARRVPRRELASIAAVLNDVLKRFRLTDGILPISLGAAAGDGSRSLAYTLKRGQSLASLSAGQQAQFAIAQMLALNLAFGRHLSHHVVILDDVVTAFDLAQLVPTCVLLRQLAYGDPESNEVGERRQVILSSHREDLTNRLVDLLSPPTGRSLKVIAFTGFDAADRGPRYEVYQANAATPAAGDLRQRFARLLALTLGD